jgi:phenylalanyl-tRNA synthetase beta chain
MKISYNWLREFVKTSKKPQEIARELTMKTAEVEGVIDFNEQYKNVVTGKIQSFKNLEGSDKLHDSVVDVGGRVARILFGAVHGVEEGWIVPVALPGAKLPNGMEIQRRKMMGIESEGMLCADDELELPLSESGFKVFPTGTKTGVPLTEALGLDDVVLEVDNKSLSHRADLLSQVGFAREVAAITGAKFVEPKHKAITQLRTASKKSKLSAKIASKPAAKRYMAVQIDGVKIEESPDWIKSRLIAVGLRPISNIVDVTNYVMYEMGQPLHAFDAASVTGTIQVRTANAKEKLQTLDGKEHELLNADVVIADDKKAIALAGVMGGANSEISQSTTSIILESATFDPAMIRKTSRRLGLLTDASLRFEKTLDPELAEAALTRACELVLELCPEAVIASNVADAKNFTKKDVVVNITHEYIESSMGTEIPKAKVLSILKGLGFGVTAQSVSYKIQVPSVRSVKDVTIPEDIVEEIARIYGFENIPSVLPDIQMIRVARDPQLAANKKLREISRDLGKNELYAYSFVDERKIQSVGFKPEDHLRLAQTAFEGQPYLQLSLVPNMLGAVSKNIANFERVNIFQVDRVFRKKHSEFDVKPGSKETLPDQPYRYASIVSSKEPLSFHDAKGEVEALFTNLGYAKDEYAFKEGWVAEYLDKTQCAEVHLHGKLMGCVGLVAKSVLNNFKIRQNATVIVLDADVIALQPPKQRTYKEVGKFPSVVRDIAVVVSDMHSAESLFQEIKKSSPLVKDVEIFDVYRGKGIDEGKRSLAFRITYQVSNRTLTDKEVDEAKKVLETRISSKFQAQIRK